MPKCDAGQHAAARCALHEALLKEVRLDDIFDDVALVAERRRDRLDPNRTARIILGNAAQVAPVHSVEEALADEQTRARAMVVDVPHPVFGDLREVGCRIKIDGVTPHYGAAAPLGADTATLLDEIGIVPAEIERLRALGVV